MCARARKRECACARRCDAHAKQALFLAVFPPFLPPSELLLLLAVSKAARVMTHAPRLLGLCACMHVCMCAGARACRVHVRMCTCMCACVRVRKCPCTHVSKQICECTTHAPSSVFSPSPCSLYLLSLPALSPYPLPPSFLPNLPLAPYVAGAAATHICGRAHTYIYAYTRPALAQRASRRGAQGQ